MNKQCGSFFALPQTNHRERWTLTDSNGQVAAEKINPFYKYAAFAETSAPESRRLALSGRRRNSKLTTAANHPLNKYSAFFERLCFLYG